jgi:hypothetical protein
MFHFHFRNTLQMGISEIPTFFVVLQNDRFFELDVIGSGTAVSPDRYRQVRVPYRISNYANTLVKKIIVLTVLAIASQAVAVFAGESASASN